MKLKILQFAVLPPPIGGVTIHVQRLSKRLLEEKEISNRIFDYSRNKNYISFFNNLLWADIVHIHLSNKKIRKRLVQILNLLGKKSLVTFHGKYDFKNTTDLYTLKKAYAVIILNDFTLDCALNYRKKNIFKIGAFLPAEIHNINPLSNEIQDSLYSFKTNYEKVFCTMASSYAVNSEGKEIYMGTALLNFFRENSKYGLIFSDSSGTYQDYFNHKEFKVPENVYMINEPHDFINVMKLSDGFIRATTMDGDSLSVKEGLSLGIPVFATNVVDRPKGCIVFNDFNELEILLSIKKNIDQITVTDNYSDLVNTYMLL